MSGLYDFCNLNPPMCNYFPVLWTTNSNLDVSHQNQLKLPPRARLCNRGRCPLVAAKQAPEPPNTRLTVGNYIADILLDARPDGTIYHWIVQRVGSAAIIHWGQEYAFEDAYASVSACLAELNDTDKKKA